MKKTTKILFFVALALLLLTVFFRPKPLVAEAPVFPGINPDTMTVREMADYWGNYYGVNKKDFEATINCESQWNPKAQGDGKRANNVLQIHRGTFDGWAREMGIELDYYSTFDHIRVGAWAFAQGESYRDDWTMYVALKNGGTYSFYSKLLGKHFTVYCNY